MITKSGWQVDVLICSASVIKKLKTYEKSRERIAPYLRHKGKSEKEIDEAARQAIDDVKRSLRIVKVSNCPGELLGNPVFLDDTRFRQDKAVDLVMMIRARLQEGPVYNTQRVLSEYIDFNLELWSYGIYEKTYKLDNFGYVGERMILVDFLELSDDLEFIKRQLNEANWSRVCGRYRLPETVNNYFVQEAEKSLTLEHFEAIWRISV
jgi:hypothetical protein